MNNLQADYLKLIDIMSGKQAFRSRRSFLTSAAGIAVLTGSGLAQEKPEWKMHLEWSVHNTGIGKDVENIVRDEWLKFDIKDKCLGGNPPIDGQGRRTAMKFAASAAVHGYGWISYLIARSTQLHNPEAIHKIEAAEGQIPNWLREVASDLAPLPDPRPSWPKPVQPKA